MKEMKSKTAGKEKGIGSVLFELFRSVKLTISLLILLAVLSIFGTVIKQNAPIDEYVHRYGESLFELLDFFSLFDMYHSWWFSAILLLLVVNLIACSVHRIPGIWSQMVRGSGSGGLEDSMVKTLPYVEKIQVRGSSKPEPESGFEPEIRKRFSKVKRIETPPAVTLFSEKGRLSRLGVPISHLSVLIILIGGLMGSVFGFRAFVNVLEGETADKVYLGGRQGETPIPLSFGLRLDDFQISYYDLPRPEKLVKEYSSVVTVLDNGNEVLKKTVRVNHPLHYKGLAFYQSSYGAIHDVTLGVQWKGQKEKTFVHGYEGDTISVPGTNFHVRVLRFEHQIQNFGEGVQVALLKPNERPRTYWVLKEHPQFNQPKDEAFVFTFEGVKEREYTGLQATKDPGVWVVWTGCALMVLGFIVSFFFSHEKIWIRIPKGPGGEIVLAGSASKNRISYEKKFRELVELLRQGTPRR
jgi:cytochrome c biogenesis protein